jgi:hypothetical protein
MPVFAADGGALSFLRPTESDVAEHQENYSTVDIAAHKPPESEALASATKQKALNHPNSFHVSSPKFLLETSTHEEK